MSDTEEVKLDDEDEEDVKTDIVDESDDLGLGNIDIEERFVAPKEGRWKYPAFILFLMIIIPITVILIQSLFYFPFRDWYDAVVLNTMTCLVMTFYITLYVTFLILRMVYKKDIRFKTFCQKWFSFCFCY